MSFTNRYSGWPLYVTCRPPPARTIVPSFDAASPDPTVGLPVTNSGGHAIAHAPEHALLPPESASNKYNVRPPESTRIDPRPLLATPTLATLVSAVAVVDVDRDGAEAGAAVAAPPPPHAASATALSGTATAPANKEMGLLRVISLLSVREHRHSQHPTPIESRNA